MLLAILRRNPKGVPLIPAFLFGEQIGPREWIEFDKREDNDVVPYSKNFAVFPKIIGDARLAVSGELRDRLIGRATLKWRRVDFAKPFLFHWADLSGFDIFEEALDEEEEALRAQGVEEHVIPDMQTTDPGLMYQKFVEKYAVSDAKAPAEYYEVVAMHMTLCVRRAESIDTVTFDDEAWPVRFAELPKKIDTNVWLFSLSALRKHGLMQLCSDLYAMTPEIFELFEPYIEPEYYSVQKVTADDLPAKGLTRSG